MAERKKAKQSETTAKPEPAFVGAVLRAARLEKKVEIDDVSHAINIRPAQIKAIEENDIDSLPGMTYAVGFVRSYANFLGLNGAEIVHRFKAEQGHEQPQADLKFPEPITESRVPSPIMVGIGAFFAVVVLVSWTLYSNMHDSGTAATQVPVAPVVTGIAGTTPPAVAQPSAATPSATVSAMPETSVPAASPVAAAPAVAEAAPPAKAAAMMSVKVVSEGNTVTVPTEAAPVKTAPAKTAPAKKAAPVKKKKEAVIRVHAPKSRVTLRATEASWVQISDAHGTVIYRKVLRTGEQYDVPDQPGLALDTANAGGLKIFVDGKRVQSLGAEGEILRGIELNPEELKIKREKIRG